MISDRRQKQSALNYIVGKAWFPQLELLIKPSRATSSRVFEITDIDVYGAVPDEFDSYRSILFDCKSSRRESPIARALWLNGLMSHFSASWGICILNDTKEINIDHRETAMEIGVSLMTVKEFNLFTTATEGELPEGISNLADIEKWDLFLQIKSKHLNLQPAIDFSSGGYWALSAAGDAVRHSIAMLRTLRGELDPAKKEHLVVFGDLLSLFLFALVKVGHRLFKAFLQPSSRQELDTVLLPYIYGGRETYQLISQLSSVISRKADTGSQIESTFPEWDMFVNLLRSILDAPMQALYAPLLAREVAWAQFDETTTYTYAAQLARSKRYTGKFCIQAAKYLAAAAKLPPEFGEMYQQVFLSIQVPPTSSNASFNIPIDQDNEQIEDS